MKLKITKIRNIIIAITILTVIIVLTLNYLSFRKNYNLLSEQAIKTAQNYMEDKYQQKFDYLRCDSLYDMCLWSVTFTDPEDPTKNIRVHMYETNDPKLPIEERIHVSRESSESKREDSGDRN